MVINSSNTFFSMINDFDPNDKVLLENIGNVLNQYPNFQLLRVLYLKSIKSQNSKDFDKMPTSKLSSPNLFLSIKLLPILS